MFSNDKAVRIIITLFTYQKKMAWIIIIIIGWFKKKTFKYYYLEINSRDASETTYIIGRLICSFSHNIISCFGSFHSLRPSPLPKKKKKDPDEDNGVGRFFSFPINAFFSRLYNGIDMMILFYNGWTCWETSMVGLENFLPLWTSLVF